MEYQLVTIFQLLSCPVIVQTGFNIAQLYVSKTSDGPLWSRKRDILPNTQKTAIEYSAEPQDGIQGLFPRDTHHLVGCD